MPERLHTDRKLIGTKQVLKALKAGRVAAVYVADDADPMLREPLVGQCRDAGVEVPTDMDWTWEDLPDPCRRRVRRAASLRSRFLRSQRNILDISG